MKHLLLVNSLSRFVSNSKGTLLIAHSQRRIRLFSSQQDPTNKIVPKSTKSISKGKPPKSGTDASSQSIDGAVVASLDEIKQTRLKKINLMRNDLNLNPFEYSFNVSHKANQLQSTYK